MDTVMAVFREWDASRTGRMHRQTLIVVLQDLLAIAPEKIGTLLDKACTAEAEYVDYERFLSTSFNPQIRIYRSQSMHWRAHGLRCVSRSGVLVKYQWTNAAASLCGTLMRRAI